MAPNHADRQRVVALFESLVAEFANLTMSLDAEAVELAIPKQPSLDFDVNINLQGNELHLNAGTGFWLEWFPCTDDGVEADFAESVRGLLSGRYRIVEQRRRGQAFKATLQRPTKHGWQNHGTWMRPTWPAWRSTRTILQANPTRTERSSWN
jgi:hypothetical protein